MKNLKKEAARSALDYLRPKQTIGLGAGSTISYLTELIHNEIQFKDTLKFVTPSPHTAELINKYHLTRVDPSALKSIDLYFDSCDQVDKNLNAFKSGGGIHTKEKLFASIASEFILLVEGSKLVPVLNTEFPLCIELFPEAAAFVLDHISSLYTDCSITLRVNEETNLPLVNGNCNLLADIYFENLPLLEELNISVKAVPGVIDHSLFYGIAAKVIVAGSKGIQLLEKNKQ